VLGRRISRSAAAVSALVVLVACGSADSADVETASVVCNELRSFADELVDIVNESVAGISTMPADMRAEAIVEGLASAHRAVEAWDTRIDRIELPDIAEADRIRVQLHDGADRALVELDDQREKLRVGPIDDREVQGAVGEWFNSIEKVMSVTEPEIFRFERREFKQAFLDEAACRNVIQQFVND
jgi:hypothetical protein